MDSNRLFIFPLLGIDSTLEEFLSPSFQVPYGSFALIVLAHAFFENQIISRAQALSTPPARRNFFLISSLVLYVPFALLVLIRKHRTTSGSGAMRWQILCLRIHAAALPMWP